MRRSARLLGNQRGLEGNHLALHGINGKKKWVISEVTIFFYVMNQHVHDVMIDISWPGFLFRVPAYIFPRTRTWLDHGLSGQDWWAGQLTHKQRFVIFFLPIFFFKISWKQGVNVVAYGCLFWNRNKFQQNSLAFKNYKSCDYPSKRLQFTWIKI